MRALINTVAFLCGLLAGTVVLRWSVGELPSQTAGALEHLAARGDEYDVIVVGSSLTKVNFVPAEFDQRMAELGHPVRSFGLGMKGMMGAELHYYVERVLQLPLRRLKWLLVDVSLDQDEALDPDAGYTRRAIVWHAPAQTLLSIRQTLAGPDPLLRQLRVIVAHLRYLFLNRGNVGLGLEALDSGIWWRPRPPVKTRGSLVAGPFLAHGQRWKVDRYLRGRAGHERARRGLKYSRRTSPIHHPGAIQRALRELARARGKPIAFVLSSMLYDARFDTNVPGDEPLRVLDLDDPGQYPELYDPELRYDELHMSYPGAVAFTRALADAFYAQLIAAPEAPARR